MEATRLLATSWTEVNGDAAWSGRWRHSSVVYDNKIYVIGGYDISTRLDDVWSSDDGGATFSEVTGTAGWSGRSGHRSVVYNNIMVSIWMMCGLWCYFQ